MRKNTTSKARSGADPVPDLKRLEALFELMNAHRIGEVEWSQGLQRLVVRTGGGSAVPAVVSSAPAYAAPVAASAAPATKPAAANQKTVTSPFVGTFYRSARPGMEPYVKEGSRVKSGDTLCIVEAMKLMNEIEAEVGGRIVAILVENGTPVEFGEPLFIIET